MSASSVKRRCLLHYNDPRIAVEQLLSVFAEFLKPDVPVVRAPGKRQHRFLPILMRDDFPGNGIQVRVLGREVPRSKRRVMISC